MATFLPLPSAGVKPHFRVLKELLHGTLDAPILKTLVRGPRHGYAIARFIEDASGEAVLVEDGSLYPALCRLELKGWVEAEWGTSELHAQRRRDGDGRP